MDIGDDQDKSVEEMLADKHFSIPEVDVWMDEAEYIKAVDLIGTAAGLAGDGQGNELGGNPEYERGMGELIVRHLGWPMDRLDGVINAIHATARDNFNKPMEG